MRKVTIALIAVLGAAVLGLSAMLVLGITGGHGWFDFSARAKLANRQAFSAEELDTIDLEYRSLRVKLIPGSGGEVIVEEHFSSWDEGMLATTHKDGGTLLVKQGDSRPRIGLFWRGYVDVYIPSDWHGTLNLTNSSGSIRTEHDWEVASLRATTKSGSIRLEGVKATGDVEVVTSSGSQSCAWVEAVGNARFEAKSGSVRPGRVEAASIRAGASSGSVAFEEARAATVEAESSSGSLSFDRLYGAFALETKSGSLKVAEGGGHGNARTSSGSLKVNLREMDGSLNLQTKSGSLRLAIPRNSGFAFNGRTGSGSLKTDFEDSLSFGRDGHEATGHVGERTGHEVDCTTSSGSLRVEWI